MTKIETRKYIYDWLMGLGIGQVFQDRKPFDDTTEIRNLRTYIVYYFEDGLIDEGPWYHGLCTVIIGCRDKVNFVADLKTLNAATEKFVAEFEKNDELKGISIINLDETSDVYSDECGNHETQFVFDVYASH